MDSGDIFKFGNYRKESIVCEESKGNDDCKLLFIVYLLTIFISIKQSLVRREIGSFLLVFEK